jgi:hypothetical protein
MSRSGRRLDELTPTLLLRFSRPCPSRRLRADTPLFLPDDIPGHRLSTAESALIMYKAVAETTGAFPPAPCLASSMLT